MQNERRRIRTITESPRAPFGWRMWQEARTLLGTGYPVSVILAKTRGFRRSCGRLESIEICRHGVRKTSRPRGRFAAHAQALATQFCIAPGVYERTPFSARHALNPPDEIFLAELFLILFGVRFFFDHHDLNPELNEAKFERGGLGYKLACWAERLTFWTAGVSIATNESYREVALARGKMRRERSFVLRSCPDIMRIQKRSARLGPRKGQRFLVVCLGAMGPQHGFDLLLESVHPVVHRSNRRDMLLFLIGAETEVPRQKPLAFRKDLAPLAGFPGRLPYEEVGAYSSTADLGVAPNPTMPMNAEPTMNKILECITLGFRAVL
jgi:glycosyltransferase involved in cell wall biosynthesis